MTDMSVSCTLNLTNHRKEEVFFFDFNVVSKIQIIASERENPPPRVVLVSPFWPLVPGRR